MREAEERAGQHGEAGRLVAGPAARRTHQPHTVRTALQRDNLQPRDEGGGVTRPRCSESRGPVRAGQGRVGRWQA